MEILKKNIIPWNTRIGDIGESEIKSRLQRISTVTKIERDVGIDFYCELLIDDKPLSPFYVQAKSANHLDKKYGRSIDRGTIYYWLNKPFPVYLIFYDDSKDVCYWNSIESNRYKYLEKLNDGNKKTICITANRKNVFNKGVNKNFKIQFESDYHSLMLFFGSPKFIGKNYVKQVPNPPRTPLEYKRVRENARSSLYSLIHLHLMKEETDDAINLSESVALFDKLHYNHFAWLGYLYKEKGIISKAIKNFNHAIKICKKDKNWNKDSISGIISRLEEELRDLRA